MADHYHALVVIPGRIVQKGKRPLVDIGAKEPLRLEWQNKLVRRAASQPENAGREVLWLIWPRTAKGKIARTSQVAGFLKHPLPADAPSPGFYALGRLEAVNLEEGFLELAILPNPEGSLAEPFTLTIWAGLEVLEALPAPGAGVRIRGELRPQSLRLVAREAAEVPLPPTKAT
jgi:hypothetical protein